jgi:hypothetical protein
MTIALRDGVAAASDLSNAPQRTIYTWFEASGGLAEVREYASAAADRSLSAAEQAVCDEVARRAGLKQMTDEELMLTFRSLVQARSVAAAGARAGAAAGAEANATVHNWSVNVNE